MTSSYFSSIAPIRFAGPTVDRRNRLPPLRARPRRARQAHGRPAALRRLLLAQLRLERLRRVRLRRHLRASLAPHGRPAGRPRWPRPTRRSTSSPAGRAVLLLPRPRRGAGRQHADGVGRALPAHGRRARAQAAATAACKLLWGTANLFSHRRYMAARRPIPIPRSSRSPRCRSRRRWRRRMRLGGENYVLWGGREGYETLLNTDLKQRAGATRPLPADGRRAQAQDRLQGHDPDRAQAARADQAPVRLRRRHRVRLPAEARAGEGSQGQHRGQPRHARRPQLRARDRDRAGARHLRLDRHEPRRPAERLGHRPVPEQPRRDGARDVHHPARRRLHHRRPQLRRQGAPPVDRSRRTCSTATSARWTCARARCSPPSR